ncbi:MAG: aa3-type cytochrome c oxidase subunit IV [Alphaproteobacteria bacterium]|nr:aa3-type cytochrome c oxidase subunit IV [Alphaproteobacteria bacterium]
MANHPATPPKVPAAMLAEHREGWRAFTRLIVWNCVATAALLLLMLLAFKVL